MMISTKGRYALRMLVDMAEHERGNTYVPLKEIAARQEISRKISGKHRQAARAEQRAHRRARQGRRLSAQRHAGSVYRPQNSGNHGRPACAVACLCEPHEPCARMVNCRTYPMWQGLSKLIYDYLESYTLADLMKNDDAGFDYII